MLTKSTSACFEPSLDYCVVKIPRWDLAKFEYVSDKLDSSMKSVGEGMAISRTFEEALQKAVRMTGMSVLGVDPNAIECTKDILCNPTPVRLLAIANALYTRMYDVDQVYELSRVDKWFLYKIKSIVDCYRSLESNLLDTQLLRHAKRLGFSDKHISNIIQSTEIYVRDLRHKSSILPEIKRIDTVAGEFPCDTNYLYATYKNTHTYTPRQDVQSNAILVLGSGVYKIGSSVEFDWCTVNCIRELRKLGKTVIILNCNPETVSTDYDEADKLYFDEVSFETVMDIYHIERPEGVIVSVGGQIPNNIAMDLHRQSVHVIGTHPESIDRAENRFKFSRMLEQLRVDQPVWKELTTVEEAMSFCDKVGYPCLVRPSYVLSGAAMNVAYSSDDLKQYLQSAINIRVSKDHPVVISKFIQDAKEIEVDAVSENGWVKLMAISEHVENAGVHSGDATLILPPQDLTHTTIKMIQKSVYKISQELKINGPFNIQFIAKDDQVKVIECNLRVSRSFPFVSKTLGVNFISSATRVILGKGCESNVNLLSNKDLIGVKVSQFSFNRLKGADILLDVEMKSTGEVACFGSTHYEAYLKALIASGFKVPERSTNVLLSIGSYPFKEEFKESARLLSKMGYTLYGTHNTANFLNAGGIITKELRMYSNDPANEETILNYVSKRRFSLIIDISERNKMRCNNLVMTDGYKLRRLAVECNVPIFTDIKSAKLLVQSLNWLVCRGSRNGSSSDSYTTPISSMSINISNVDCFTSYKTIKLPGLIDVHVHVREPGEEYKEDWSSCTKAALCGGITTILAMPNTKPAVLNQSTLEFVDNLASRKAHCDYGLYLGASSSNTLTVYKESDGATSLKMYLNNTHGDLLLKSTIDWEAHIRGWEDPVKPVCVHAEGSTLAGILFIAEKYKRKVHVCHVSTEEEINLVKMAKEKGMNVTCEVSPHHLFLTDEMLNEHIKSVKPPLAKQSDIDALWKNLDIIDCFATDHAPHTLDDKCKNCPGFPGLETALPLLLTAVHEGRMSINDIVQKYHTNPAKIFNLKVSPDTYIEVYTDYKWTLPDKPLFSKCGWSPFAGKTVYGYVNRVVIRGETVYIDGNVVNQPGFGRNVKGFDYDQSHQSVQYNRRNSISIIDSINNIEITESITPYKPKSTLSNIVSISQLDKDTLNDIFEIANEMKELDNEKGCLNILNGKILGLMFYEPSTRTRCSFEAAMLKLGGKAIHIPSSSSSTQKGETLEDTIRTVEQYCDAIVLRHPDDDSSLRASAVSKVPIINAGAGADSHPTQAILDLYTIREEIGTLNGKCITLIGDLKYGRTVHSLVELLLTRRNIRFKFVSPVFLRMPDEIKTLLSNLNIEYTEYTNIDEVIDVTDVLYVTRIQKERLNEQELHVYVNQRIEEQYRITPHTLSKAKSTMCILHPLPRVTEISQEVDTDPRAAYFRQMKNGLYVRMAILKMILQ